MTLNFEFRNKLHSIPVALSKLQLYTSKTGHVPVHIKIIYNVVEESSFLDAKFSNEVSKSEITNDLISSINYIYSELISTYLMSYKKVFLSRIIIESDIDMLGVVFESIQVTCKFKTNARNYSLSQQELLNLIFEQTVDAERNEILERPPERIKLYLLRNKLRSIQLFFDYSIQEEFSSYGKNFTSDFKLALYGLIHDYESHKNYHKADFHVSFDLTKRNNLTLVEGSVYPTQLLSGDADSEVVERILREVDPILSNIDTAQITRLVLKHTNRSNYKCQFELRRAKNTPLNCIDLTKVETLIVWSHIFKTSIDNFLVAGIRKQWNQTVKIDLRINGDELVPCLYDYCLSFNCNKNIPVDLVVSRINLIANSLQNKAQIEQIIYQTENDKTRLIELHIQPTNELDNNTFLAMKLKPIKLQGIITRYFDKSKQGYFLSAEEYQSVVK